MAQASASAITSEQTPYVFYMKGDRLIAYSLPPVGMGSCVPIRVRDGNRFLPGELAFKRQGDEFIVTAPVFGRGMELKVRLAKSHHTPAQLLLIQFLHNHFPDLALFNFEYVNNPFGAPPKKPRVRPPRVHPGPRTPPEEDEEDEIEDDPRAIVQETRILLLKGRNMVIKGYLQSAKSSCILNLSLRFSVDRFSAIIVLRNFSADARQLAGRATEYIRELIHEVGLDGRIEYEFIGDIPEDEQEFQDFITAKTPRALIVISHEGTLEKITQKLQGEGSNQTRCILFVDEDDLLEASDSSAYHHIKHIEKHAYCSYGISATAFDCIVERKVKADDKVDELIVLNRPEFYCGIESLVFPCFATPRSYDVKEDAKFSHQNVHNLHERDPNLDAFVSRMIMEKPIWSSFYEKFHPRIVLISICYAIQPILRYAERIVQHTEGKVNVMTVNGSDVGIQLYSPKFKDTPSVTLPDGKVSRKRGNKHVWLGSNPQAVLSMLKDADQHPITLILIGKIGSRGLCLTSGNCAGKEFNIHVTDYRILCADSASVPESYQRLGRACRIDKTGVPVNVYCTKKFKDEMMNYHNVQEELLDRARKQQTARITQAMMREAELSAEPQLKADMLRESDAKGKDEVKDESIPTVPAVEYTSVIASTKIHKDKVPKKGITRAHAIGLRKVSGDDGGVALAKYKKYNHPKQGPCFRPKPIIPYPKTFEEMKTWSARLEAAMEAKAAERAAQGKREREVESDGEEEIPADAEEELTEEEKLEKKEIDHFLETISKTIKSGAQTIIIRILHWFKIHGGKDAVINKDGLDFCGVKKITQYTEWKRSHQDYKVLIKRDDGTYNLNPSIVSVLDQIKTK